MPITLDANNGINFPTWTTATRPASPSVGQLGYNTTTGLFDNYTAAGWVGGLTNASRSVPASAVPAGSVIQVISGELATQVSVSSTTYANIGLSATITPQFSTSKVLIICMIDIGKQTANNGGAVQLARNNSAIFTPSQADGTGPYQFYSSAGDDWRVVPLNYLDSPGNTSAVTYAVQARVYASGNNIYFNGFAGVATPAKSNMVLMEIAV